jgi:hypothetical protein
LPDVRAVGAIIRMFWRGDGGAFELRAVEGHPPEERYLWSPYTPPMAARRRRQRPARQLLVHRQVYQGCTAVIHAPVSCLT